MNAPAARAWRGGAVAPMRAAMVPPGRHRENLEENKP